MNPLGKYENLKRAGPSESLIQLTFCSNASPLHLAAAASKDPNMFDREVPMHKKPVFPSLSSASKDMVIRRNYLCPEYEKCLDQAAYGNFDLVCSECLLKDKRQLDAVLPAGCQPGSRALLEVTLG
jgi:hypothetical protein